MTTTKRKWLLVGLALIGGIALWIMYAPNQGAKWESYITAGQQAYQQADYAEAEKQFEAALKEAEAFGPDEVRLATSLNELGLVYDAQGRYAEAEPLYQRSMAIWEKALGPDHPDVGQSLNYLGLLYFGQGRYAEAEPLYQRALAIWEKVLGPEHPDVAYSLNNLAILYQVQGRYEEAETHFVWVLAIREDALGLDHPSVAASLEDYAALLRQTGRATEATEMEARAKAIRAKRAQDN